MVIKKKLSHATTKGKANKSNQSGNQSTKKKGTSIKKPNKNFGKSKKGNPIQKASIESKISRAFASNQEDKKPITASDIDVNFTRSDIYKKYAKLHRSFIKDQIEAGIQVEMEHTSDPLIAEKIALDHLNENIFYYVFLSKMEKQLDKINIPKEYKKYLETHGKKYGDDNVIKESNFKSGGYISNLTTEQQKLVRTPEFKAWFGDWENDPANASKVVDKNGEPLVVYHGSKEKFNLFDKAKINKDENYGINGFFFSNHYHVAYNYTEYIHVDKHGWKTNKRNKRNVISVFLNIRNPKTFFPVDTSGDGIIDKSNGYFIAFFPEQIKLADGSNMTFDANNPDIRYQSGALLPHPQLHRSHPDYQKNANKMALGGVIIQKNPEKLISLPDSYCSFERLKDILEGQGYELSIIAHAQH